MSYYTQFSKLQRLLDDAAAYEVEFSEWVDELNETSTASPPFQCSEGDPEMAAIISCMENKNMVMIQEGTLHGL